MKVYEYCNIEATIFGEVEAESRYEAVRKIERKLGHEIDMYWAVEEKELLEKMF